MKKIALALIFAYNITSAQDTVYVPHSGGAISKIDSIIFNKSNSTLQSNTVIDIDSIIHENKQLRYLNDSLVSTIKELSHYYDSVSTFLPNMFVVKKNNLINVYVKRIDATYIKYPLEYRYSPWNKTIASSSTANIYKDNWGIGRVSCCSYSNGVFSDVLPLFSDGEAELAMAVNGNSFVGGSAHGYENIVTDELGNRKIFFRIDTANLNEKACFSGRCDSVIVYQTSRLSLMQTQKQFAEVEKRWIFTKDKVSMSVNLTMLSNEYINIAYFNMFCVSRQNTYDTLQYITNKAIKNSDIHRVYNLKEYWWNDINENSIAKADTDCSNIKMYGDYPISFEMEVADCSEGYKSMFITQNTRSTNYNKVYFTKIYKETLNKGNTVYATVNWYFR